MKKLLTAAVATVAIGGCLPANAAQFWVNQGSPGGYAIHIRGEIVKGDADRFADAVRKGGLKPGEATVYLDSMGGLVTEGIPIARSIKKHEWNTYVPSATTCVSMCANIWLAGHTRYVSTKARIGFHSLSDRRNPKERNEQANAAFLPFYKEMGISAKAGRVFLAAEPGADAIWLDVNLARSLSIAFTAITFEQEMAGEQPNNPVNASYVSRTNNVETPKTDAPKIAYLVASTGKSQKIDTDVLTPMPIAQQRPSTLPAIERP